MKANSKNESGLYLATNTPNGYLEGYGLHQVTDLDKMLDEARKDLAEVIPEPKEDDYDMGIPDQRHQFETDVERHKRFLKWFGEKKE